MIEPKRFSPRNLAVLALVIVGVIAGLLALDRRSMERANRQYRGGAVSTAAEMYGRFAPGPDGRIAYNRGTATIALGNARPDSLLLDATLGSDSAARQRAFYNLGFVRLTRVDAALDVDSAYTVLRQSVDYTREALRLDPGDEAARWNLALAQRMLDSLSLLRVDPESRQSSGDDDTPVELLALTRSPDGTGESGMEPENPESGESIGERRGASQGARESWATQDPGPMTGSAAMALVQSVRDDPEQLLRGILWSHRPDVAWWNAEPYPGGDW